MSKKRIRAFKVIAADCCAPSLPVVGNCYKCYVLPDTAEAYEQMVEQMAQAMLCGIGYEPMVRRALRAIGITAPKKGRT